MNKIYQDETHCLTSPEIRADRDLPISCFCRDAIEDARYVRFTYLLSGRDNNFSGIFLALQAYATEACNGSREAQPKSSVGEIINLIQGSSDPIYVATMEKNWSWNGPEVVRTYPADEVIARISPEMRDGKPVGRWVPFTVQLVYRDAQGHVTRTENYASREYEPVFPK